MYCSIKRLNERMKEMWWTACVILSLWIHLCFFNYSTLNIFWLTENQCYWMAAETLLRKWKVLLLWRRPEENQSKPIFAWYLLAEKVWDSERLKNFCRCPVFWLKFSNIDSISQSKLHIIILKMPHSILFKGDEKVRKSKNNKAPSIKKERREEKKKDRPTNLRE